MMCLYRTLPERRVTTVLKGVNMPSMERNVLVSTSEFNVGTRTQTTLTLFDRREADPHNPLKRTCARSSVGGLRLPGRLREHAPTVPPHGPVTGPPYRCRSTVLSVLLYIKEKAPGCTQSWCAARAFIHVLQQSSCQGTASRSPPIAARCVHRSCAATPASSPSRRPGQGLLSFIFTMPMRRSSTVLL